MSLTGFIGLLGFLLVLAFIANRLSRRTGIPDILVLMAVGIVIGPTLHWINAAKFEPATRGFGTLALILIIFEAGLELKLRDTLKYFPPGLILSAVSYVLSTAAASLVCGAALGIPHHAALIAGAALGCMSSGVVLPVLQQVDLRESTRVTLLVEASFGDALGVLTVGSLLEIFYGVGANGAPAPPHLMSTLPGVGILLKGVAGNFILRMGLSILIGVAAAYLWSRVLPYLSDERSWRMLTLGAVLILYCIADFLHASDLFTVMAFGIALANIPMRGLEWGKVHITGGASAQTQHEILSFHSELGFLVRTFFFVLIGAIIHFGDLRRSAWISFSVLGALFIMRAVSVQICRAVWRKTTHRERELATLMFPRGLVTAVLALQIAEPRPVEFSFLIPLAFGLILLTNVLLLVGTVRARATATSDDTLDVIAATPATVAIAVAESVDAPGSGASPSQE